MSSLFYYLYFMGEGVKNARTVKYVLLGSAGAFIDLLAVAFFDKAVNYRLTFIIDLVFLAIGFIYRVVS